MGDDGREIEGVDFPLMRTLPPPVKRAAYSDRTAWLMAAMSELAYIRVESSRKDDLLTLAKELIAAEGQSGEAERLNRFQKELDKAGDEPRQRLEATLGAAGFELVEFFAIDDTEGFIAARPDSDAGPGLAVLAFRGTTSLIDWTTNIQIKVKEVKTLRTVRGVNAEKGTAGLHSGFLNAYKKVEDVVEKHLQDPRVSSVPLYITGHSLGGALAVVGTWRIKSRYNAACYTFGAPRAGTLELASSFKTPIYRVVHGPDPVPMVPPSDNFIRIFRLLAGWIPGVPAQTVAWARTLKGYRHYGDKRYLDPEQNRIIPSAGAIDHLFNIVRQFRININLVQFHEIGDYRRKLKEIALERNSGRGDLIAEGAATDPPAKEKKA
jgi:hypothetical protein